MREKHKTLTLAKKRQVERTWIGSRSETLVFLGKHSWRFIFHIEHICEQISCSWFHIPRSILQESEHYLVRRVFLHNCPYFELSNCMFAPIFLLCMFGPVFWIWRFHLPLFREGELTVLSTSWKDRNALNMNDLRIDPNFFVQTYCPFILQV